MVRPGVPGPPVGCEHFIPIPPGGARPDRLAGFGGGAIIILGAATGGRSNNAMYLGVRGNWDSFPGSATFLPEFPPCLFSHTLNVDNNSRIYCFNGAWHVFGAQ